MQQIPYINDNILYSLDSAKNFLLENPDSILNKDELAAIYLYTLEVLYRPLNAALNERDRDKIKPYFPYLKLMNSALEKLP